MDTCTRARQLFSSCHCIKNHRAISKMHSATEASPLLPVTGDGRPGTIWRDVTPSDPEITTKGQKSLTSSIREFSTQLSSFITYHTGSIGTVGE
jgi:hypothetical protein